LALDALQERVDRVSNAAREGFDISLLVAFTEDFGVDHPSRRSTTDRALDDVHG
jgi:hypothetical protein